MLNLRTSRGYPGPPEGLEPTDPMTQALSPDPQQVFGEFFGGDGGLDAALETQPEERAIVLEGEDRERFEFRFIAALDNARSRMHEIHEEARKDREVYRMLAREPAYEGGPDITTPLSANKTDGVLAHIRDAVEQRPLISFQAEGIGRPAEEATEVAHLAEAYLEREINQSGSREKFAAHLGREATQVGTGIARLSLAQYPTESFVQFGHIIRLENFFVDRVNVNHLKDTFCAYEYKERMYNLDDQADLGYVDQEAIEKLRAWGLSTSKHLISEEEEFGFSDAHAFAEENAIHTLACGFMRFRPVGERKAQLYEAIYHPTSRTFLAIRPNPASKAFDAPPLTLHRIGKQAGYLLGRGIVRRLEAEQKMADNAINNHMALANLASSPPFAYQMNSPFGKALSRTGKRGIYPGMGIPTANKPDKSDVVIYDQFENRGQALQDMDVAFGFADRATYTEEAIGSNSDPRKTLGQFQVEVQKGTMRLRVDVADFAYDAALAFTMYWAMVVAYKIVPQGVVEIEDEGRLVSADDVGEDEIEQLMAQAMAPMILTQEINQQELVQLDERMRAKLTNGRIPGVRRGNLSLSLSGTKIIADKVGELQMLQQLTPLITSLLGAAAEDSYINYHLRSIMKTMGFSDVDKRMPADPGKVLEENEDRQRLVMRMEEILMRSAVQ